MIEESIDDYSGVCPCPYSLNSAHHECGDTSAYRKRGGQKPLCYPKDISDSRVDKYRKDHNIAEPKSDR